MGSRHESAKDRSESSQRPPAAHRATSVSRASAIGNLDLQRHIKGALAGDVEHARAVTADLGEGNSVPGSAARIHTDATAAQLADAADARAFTIGHDIVLARDAPQPGTLAGDALLAHELAHVQQQTIGGGGPEASSERDADLAGASVVADRLGVPLPVSRRVTGTRLSLQRCWKKGDDKSGDKAKDGPSVTGDGGVPQDAAVDAALPPGKRSWVASTIAKATKSGAVTGKDVSGFDEAAAQFGGNKTAVAKLIAQYNPSVDETKIGPKTKFNIPTSIELPAEAEKLDDPDDPSSVAFETWTVEEDPRGATASLKASVPSSSSGVTLGRGYDMKERSANRIETELLAAGIDAKTAKAYRGAAGKSGKTAKAWLKQQSIAPITAAQEKLLFINEYQATTNEVIAETLAKPEIGVDGGYKQDGTELKLDIDLAHLDPVILAFVVDLRFRGDLNKGWRHIKDAVRANDLKALQAIVGDVGKHKKFFYDNYIRYASRCRLVGLTPVDQKTFDATL